MGRYEVAAILRASGVRVEIHDDHFDMRAADVEWLAEVGRRRWVLLTKDRHILTRSPEIVALLSARIHAFILKQGSNQELTGKQIGAAFSKAMPHMLRLVSAHTPPFLARVTPTGDVTEIEGYQSIQERVK